MKTAGAWLTIEVFVECPHCGYLTDLMREDDICGINYNEEGEVTRQVCPDRSWVEAHKDFTVENVQCGRCKDSFNVEGLEW